MKISNPSHPVWDFLRTLLILLALSVVLFFNAVSFDENEMKILVQSLLIFLGIDATKYHITKRINGKNGKND